jgi:hypothetical protein
MSTESPQERTPPVGEEIHMPAPSLLPIISAGALTAIVVGLTINLIFSAVGLAILIVCVYRWVSETARDVSSLPEEHRHS